MTARLVVIGGGLAGIAAALRLAEAGEKPLLLETRRQLGGRASSFVDPRDGRILDNCQHVVLGCCTHLIDLFERLGVLDRIEWHQTLHWTAGGGEIDSITPGRLPAPFHLAGGLGRMRFLDSSDRKSIRGGMWRLIRLGPSGGQRWAGHPFSDLLSELGQTDRAIELFWNAIIVSACNLPVNQVEAAHAIQVFRDGFLSNRFGSAMGLSTVPLGDLYAPAVNRIEQLGGDIVEGVSVRSLAYDGKRVTGVVTPDGMINSTAVVAAVPPDRLAKLVSPTMIRADSRLRHLNQFEFSPILGVHLYFDQPIMKLPHMVLVGMGSQWIFNKGVNENGHQHLHVVISAADDWMGLDEAEIVRRVTNDVHRVLPGAVGLEPVGSRTVKEKRATFAAIPGIDDIRPRAAPSSIGLGGGGVRNLFLAGDWCQTGWPATMEGAVRSGYSAAGAIVGRDMDVGDLPPGALAHFLGLRSSGRISG